MDLETYLDKLPTNKIPNKILSAHEYFGYKYNELFKLDLNLLLTHVYTEVNLVQEQKTRLEQHEFRSELLKLYNGACVISGNDCEEELEACHIVPFSDKGESDLSNGLILERNIHATFDKYYWSINPDTLEIEVNPNKKTKSINKYIGNKVNLTMNPFLYCNLKSHYEKFINFV